MNEKFHGYYYISQITEDLLRQFFLQGDNKKYLTNSNTETHSVYFFGKSKRQNHERSWDFLKKNDVKQK